MGDSGLSFLTLNYQLLPIILATANHFQSLRQLATQLTRALNLFKLLIFKN